MRFIKIYAVPALALFTAVACGTSPGGDAPPLDAGAGTMDAGPLGDAGDADGGVFDGGSDGGFDGGAPDAVADSGVAADAAADGGTALDAGTDASNDAGSQAFLPVSFAAVTVGTCALSVQGAVKCWGSESLGLEGAGYRGDAPGEMATLLPISLGVGVTAEAIAGGYRNFCAVLSGGSLKCWGANDYGQLGVGDTNARGQTLGTMGDALPVVPVGAVSQVATNRHTCAVLANGTVKCWGKNEFGELGYGDKRARGGLAGEVLGLSAVDIGAGRKAQQVGVGAHHSCALLDNGSVKCWGNNTWGQLGYGNTTNLGDAPNEMGANLPAVDLGLGRTATAIAIGGGHSCALLDNKTIKCWGLNDRGAVGDGSTTNRGDGPNEMGANLPAVTLPPGRTALAVAASTDDQSASHTCALLDDGNVTCWGDNRDGELGLGSTATALSGNHATVALGTGRRAVKITCGQWTTCALLDDNTMKCWGHNAFGQLGQGSKTTLGDGPNELGDALPAITL